MSELSDDSLVRMYRGGDVQAFDVIFDRHHAMVYRWALALLRDTHKAEDVLQEAFAAAVQALPRYEPRGHFRAWLLRIVRNRCLNRIESDRPRLVIVGSPLLEVVEPVAPEPSPAEQAATSDAHRCIARAMAELPARQREALTLYALEQMPYDEIADAMEMPINTVKTLIHRARVHLATRLEEYRKETPRGL